MNFNRYISHVKNNTTLVVFFVCSFIVNSCMTIEDATPAKRNTFIRFYEAAHTLTAVAAEPVEDGFIILANEELANGNFNSIIIHTDKNGQRIADDILLTNGISKALKVGTDGYYVIGDSIKSNEQSEDIADFEVFSARLYKIGLTGEILNKLVIADRTDTIRITDIHGGAVTLSGDTSVVILGTFKTAETGSTEKPYIASLDPTTFDTLWSKNYDIIDRDYINANSINVTASGDFIWACSLLKENQNFSRSYLALPVIKGQSVFVNNDLFGETTDQRLSVNDLQPNGTAAYGFAIIGSYATPEGSASNMFFLRADQNGNIIDNSVRYFDGELSEENEVVTADQSASEDTGDALIATSDGGYVLAGSMQTTPNRGNGGKDIFLVKVDALGNPQWNKIIGGQGNETVSSIRETEDGGLLICGTNDLSGLSSVFLLKTDKDGELKD